MTPAARVQAAIELLDRIIVAAREGGAAADTLIARAFAERRYAGSKDRRAIREHVYDVIRLLGDVPAGGRAAMLALAAVRPELGALFDGSRHGPAPIATDERVAEPGIAPGWLVEELEAAELDGAEQKALLERAPLDIRVNRLKSTRNEVATLFAGAVPIDGTEDGLRLPPDTVVEGSDAWKAGMLEVQDAGSQRVALAADARAGMTVVDLCAGGGGKTLALAAAMENSGRIFAADADRARLSRLPPRAERAGVTIVETRLLDPGRELAALEDVREAADLVLVDAPCSGTGTWRRNPEARWRLTPERLRRLTELQARLLDVAAELVKPGGRLVHVVCSLLDAEGADQVNRFLQRHPGWTAEPLAIGRPRGAGARLTPASDGTDGFFVARLVRAW